MSYKQCLQGLTEGNTLGHAIFSTVYVKAKLHIFYVFNRLLKGFGTSKLLSQ